MISPYVKRLTLARLLVELRGDVTHVELRKRTGVSQSALSRLENGRHRPNVGDVMKILEALDASADQWQKVIAITHEAAQRGWWDSEEIDERQARYADLEAGAATIREYQAFYIPGLLQIPAYVAAVAVSDDLDLPGAAPPDPTARTRSRSGRQRMLRRPGGPTYEVILDEVAVRRRTAPPDVLADQLRFLADPGEAGVSVRILPIDATIEHYSVPKGAFSLYTYPDQDDPEVVAVDTVTSDLVLVKPGEVRPYERLYDRLRGAALSVQDSAAMLREAATRLEGST